MKQYEVIYADPPWPYKDKAQAGNRGVEFKYPVMTEKQIKGLQVDRLCAENCALFMWCTPPRMPLAFEVLRAWGFAYKTIAFTWVKTRSEGKLHWGMGNWTRANPEHVLLGIRGKPKRIDAGVHSVVMSELRKHSEKPPEVRDRIVQLVGDVPRIELFSRVKPVGWDTWGNQVENDVELVQRADALDVMNGKVDETPRPFGTER